MHQLYETDSVEPEPLPEPLPEPWLRGPIEGVHPLVAPILYAFQQAREDLARYAGPLSPGQIWSTPYGFGSAGFHLRHIAGSTDRLMTYLQGRALTSEQLVTLAQEHEPAGADARELLELVDGALRNAEAVVRSLHVNQLAEPRTVGRKHLPTTVIGLLIHIAEHTQRHVGQAIAAAKLSVHKDNCLYPYSFLLSNKVLSLVMIYFVFLPTYNRHTA
jgi:uncharacterized damage-inducible protein DinB